MTHYPLPITHSQDVALAEDDSQIHNE